MPKQGHGLKEALCMGVTGCGGCVYFRPVTISVCLYSIHHETWFPTGIPGWYLQSW